MERIKFEDVKIEIKKMPELELKDINCAYIGKPNECMCGCSGEYFYTKANQEKSGKNRGYKVSDEEVDERKIQTVLVKMIKNAEKGIEVLDLGDRYIFTLILGSKQYVIYTF